MQAAGKHRQGAKKKNRIPKDEVTGTKGGHGKLQGGHRFRGTTQFLANYGQKGGKSLPFRHREGVKHGPRRGGGREVSAK